MNETYIAHRNQTYEWVVFHIWMNVCDVDDIVDHVDHVVDNVDHVVDACRLAIHMSTTSSMTMSSTMYTCRRHRRWRWRYAHVDDIDDDDIVDDVVDNVDDVVDDDDVVDNMWTCDRRVVFLSLKAQNP